MDKQYKPIWAKDLYKDFPEHKDTIESLCMTTEHFKDLAQDYCKCKSTLKRLSKEQDTRKLDQYQFALDALRSELVELFGRSI